MKGGVGYMDNMAQVRIRTSRKVCEKQVNLLKDHIAFWEGCERDNILERTCHMKKKDPLALKNYCPTAINRK